MDDFKRLGLDPVPTSAPAMLGAEGDLTPPLLDDFNRPDENPLSQNGAWSPVNLYGTGDTLAVTAQQAGNTGPPQTVVSSYRAQGYAGDMQASLTITQPSDTIGIALNVREEGSSAWDGYLFYWNSLDGGDTIVLVKMLNGQFDPSIPPDPPYAIWQGPGVPEMTPGDKLLVRKFGADIEGWVNDDGAWVQAFILPNTLYVGGKIGVWISGNGRIDDFGGGSLDVSPPPAEQTIGNCGRGVHAYSRSACREGVNTLTGAYTTQVADLELSGIGVPFRWTRSYTSSDLLIGGLGCGWTTSYEARLADATPPPLARSARLTTLGSGDLLLRGEDGQQVLYTRQCNRGQVYCVATLARATGVRSPLLQRLPGQRAGEGGG